MIRRFFFTCAVLMSLLSFGCGNKGPLYLPQDTQPPSAEQDAETPE